LGEGTRKGIGKLKIGLVICIVVIVILAGLSIWFYMNKTSLESQLKERWDMWGSELYWHDYYQDAYNALKHAVTYNQVQVSGAVSETQTGTIKFDNKEERAYNKSIPLIESSVPIVNGQYSILLLGGHSYSVYIYLAGDAYYSYWGALYVPLGVTTFIANW